MQGGQTCQCLQNDEILDLHDLIINFLPFS